MINLRKNSGSAATCAGTISASDTGGVAMLAANATDLNTVGSLVLEVSGSGIDNIAMKYAIVPWNPYDGVRLGLSSLPNASAGAASGLPVLNSSALQIVGLTNPSAGAADGVLQVYYVKKGSGSDGGNGTPDAPFNTLAHALTVATPGSVIFVQANEAGTADSYLTSAANVSIIAGAGTIYTVSFVSGAATSAALTLGSECVIKGLSFTATMTNQGSGNGLTAVTAGTGCEFYNSTLAVVGQDTGNTTAVAGAANMVFSGPLMAVTSSAAGGGTATNISGGTYRLRDRLLATGAFVAGIVEDAANANLARIGGSSSSNAASSTAAATFGGTMATPTNITAGTIANVTNLTNAPTAGDFTTAMKTSLNAATPTAAAVTGSVGSVTGSVGSVTGNVGGNVIGTVAGVTPASSAQAATIISDITALGTPASSAQAATIISDITALGTPASSAQAVTILSAANAASGAATTAATAANAASGAATTASTNTSSLPAMIVADQFTVSALANAPSGGGGSGGAAVFTLSQIIQTVANATATIGTLTFTRGCDGTQQLAGFTGLTSATQIWMTAKNATTYSTDPDSAAQLQITKTGGATYINGSTASTGTLASMSVVSATTLNLTVTAAGASLFTPGNYIYDVKVLSSGVISEPAFGEFIIPADVTRATS